MEIEIKKYVLEQLNGQCIRRKRIDVLEFELETLMSQADEKAREVIEAMAFSHGDGEHVQTSDISDITADIAMSYRSAITDCKHSCRMRNPEREVGKSCFFLQIASQSHFSGAFEAENNENGCISALGLK